MQHLTVQIVADTPPTHATLSPPTDTPSLKDENDDADNDAKVVAVLKKAGIDDSRRTRGVETTTDDARRAHQLMLAQKAREGAHSLTHSLTPTHTCRSVVRCMFTVSLCVVM